MSYLNDIIGSAVQDIHAYNTSTRTNVQSTLRGTSTGIKSSVAGVVPGILRNSTPQVGQSVNQAANILTNDISQAANKAIHGDFSGALGTLLTSPSDVLGSLAKSFGLSKGSTLKGPGANGAEPGNSLAGALARSDPVMSFNWYALMPDVSPLDGGIARLPWYYVEEAQTPFRNFDTRPIYHEGRHRYYPSTYSVGSLTLAIYADTDNVALDYLQAWSGSMLVKTTSGTATTTGGAYGRPKDYKKTIKIALINPAKQELAILEYIECWPTEVQAYSLDSGSSTRVVNHVTFSVGDVFLTTFSLADGGLNPLSSGITVPDLPPEFLNPITALDMPAYA